MHCETSESFGNHELIYLGHINVDSRVIDEIALLWVGDISLFHRLLIGSELCQMQGPFVSTSFLETQKVLTRLAAKTFDAVVGKSHAVKLVVDTEELDATFSMLTYFHLSA